MPRPQTSRIVCYIRWTRVLLHVSLALLIVGTTFRRASVAKRARLTRWWSAKLLRILRITLAIHGERPEWLQPNLVIAANHISWVDIYVINAVRPERFVAKAEIRDWPIVGWLCDKAGTIFIMRARRSHTAKINEVIHDVLVAGDCVGLFPEGTTSPGDMLRKFHRSLFEPAVANQALVAPAAIRYRRPDGEMCREVAFIDDLSFAESLGLVIRQPSLVCDITFAAPIPTQGMHRREVTALAENAVANILNVKVSGERFALGGADLAARTAGFSETP